MARCPFAVQRLLPESSSQPRIVPVGVIDHTIVGSVEGADSYFRRSTNVETHFGVRADGQIWQWMDTTVRADGNYKGNSFAAGSGYVSIETAGYPDEPWTSDQIDALVRLHVWLGRTHAGIAHRILRRCYDAGFGHHTLFGSPSCLTPVAKSCPGGLRIGQWRTAVIPRTLAGLASASSSAAPEEGNFMANMTQREFNAYLERGFEDTQVARGFRELARDGSEQWWEDNKDRVRAHLLGYPERADDPATPESEARSLLNLHRDTERKLDALTDLVRSLAAGQPEQPPSPPEA